MGRRSRPARRGVPPLRAPESGGRIERGPDGRDHRVRPVAAARALKIYRCPGCDHDVRPGTAHVVVWPVEQRGDAVDDRRHWHTPCWGHRDTRSPTRRWS